MTVYLQRVKREKEIRFSRLVLPEPYLFSICGWRDLNPHDVATARF